MTIRTRKSDSAPKGASTVSRKPISLVASPGSIARKNEAPRDKYFLKSIHQEIDFYDRKLAYLRNYEAFASLAEREDAERKMLAKRAALAQTAKRLAADGVEFNQAELPRSFRSQEPAHRALAPSDV